VDLTAEILIGPPSAVEYKPPVLHRENTLYVGEVGNFRVQTLTIR
jgi:hypothetical protein